MEKPERHAVDLILSHEVGLLLKHVDRRELWRCACLEVHAARRAHRYARELAREISLIVSWSELDPSEPLKSGDWSSRVNDRDLLSRRALIIKFKPSLVRETRLSVRWDTVMSVLVRKEHLALTHIIHQEDIKIDRLVRLKQKLKLVTLP